LSITRGVVLRSFLLDDAGPVISSSRTVCR
jgi:hypothetical protein